MSKLEDYLCKIHTGQWFGFEGDKTYKNLVIIDDQYDKPTEQECVDGVAQMESESKLQQVENNRRNAYRNEADPLYLKWQRGEATEQEWLDKIEEIRERFPKPE